MTRYSFLQMSQSLMGGLPAIMLALSCASSLLAEDLPAASSASNVQSASPVSSQKAGETYTHESLGKALEDMGYEVKNVSISDTPIYDMVYAEGGFAGTFSVELSKDQSNVWVYAQLTTFAKDEAIPAEVLVEILDANLVGCEFFQTSVGKDGMRRLFLASYTPNHHQTRVQLRTQIKKILERIAATEKLWNRKLWKPDNVAKQ